jgi:hypothetical protein
MGGVSRATGFKGECRTGSIMLFDRSSILVLRWNGLYRDIWIEMARQYEFGGDIVRNVGESSAKINHGSLLGGIQPELPVSPNLCS